jgi:hypothetical protein
MRTLPDDWPNCTGRSTIPADFLENGSRERTVEEMAMNERIERGAGGTPGGIGQFLIGLGMAVAGAFLLTNQVTVTTGFWHMWGFNTFGLVLIPLIVGIGFLFFDGKSKVGWILTFAGAIIIFVGILVNLDIYFRATSLFNTILMLVLLTGGIGLIARSLSSKGS